MAAVDEQPGRRRAVISDVARLAGVSTQTVSRVLNEGVVAEDTRERVTRAITMLDYRPNGAERSLRTLRAAR